MMVPAKFKIGSEIERDSEAAYAAFDRESDLAVCEAYMCAWWAGDPFVLGGEPAVVQKIPWRVRVGLSRAEEPTVTVGKYLFYDAESDTVTPGRRTIGERKELGQTCSYIENTLKRLGRLTHGCRVNILEETRPGRAPFVPGTLTGARSAAMAVAIASTYQTLTASQLDQWVSPWAYTGPEERNAADSVFRFAWKLAVHGHWEIFLSSGADVFCALCTGKNPFLYRANDLAALATTRRIETDRLLSAIDSMAVRGRMLLGQDHQATIDGPLNYGILYSGEPKHTDDSMQGYLDWLSSTVDSAAAGRGEDADQRSPNAAKWSRGEIARLVQAAPSMLTTRIADTMRTLLDRPVTRHAGDPEFGLLLRDVNALRHMAIGFGMYEDNVVRTCNALDGAAAEMYLPLAVKLSGYGRGGALIFAAPSPSLADPGRIDELIERARQKGAPSSLRLLYASWGDQWKDPNLGDGVRIIRSTSLGIRSPYQTRPDRGVGRFVVFASSVPYQGRPVPYRESATEVDSRRRGAVTFQIFLDDPNTMLLLNGRPVKIRSETLQYHCLVFLLMRSGEYLTDSRLVKAIKDVSKQVVDSGNNTVSHLQKNLGKDLFESSGKRWRIRPSVGTCLILPSDSPHLSAMNGDG